MQVSIIHSTKVEITHIIDYVCNPSVTFFLYSIIMYLPFYKTLESQENSLSSPVVSIKLLRVPKVQAENSLLLPKHTVTACIHK